MEQSKALHLNFIVNLGDNYNINFIKYYFSSNKTFTT